jgi:protein O-mannosyl-transferase
MVPPDVLPNHEPASDSNVQPAGCTQNRILRVLALICLILVPTSLVYYPGLRGPFVFDDWSNFAADPAIRISTLGATELWNAAFGNHSELLLRPLSRVSFALNYLAAGKELSPIAFKATNLALHIINTLLVYWLTRLLLRTGGAKQFGADVLATTWVPVFVACLWALHPLQLTSVLYVVQRMNTLSAMCVFAGVIAYVHGRLRLSTSPRSAAILIMAVPAIAMVAGIGFKENAAILPMFLVVTELTLFDRNEINPRARQLIRGFFGTCIAVPLLFAAVLYFSGILQSTYAGRNFNPEERLLTEARLLWHYIGMLVFPTPNQLTLFHDDIPISSGLLSPWTTLPAIVLHGAAIAAALFVRLRYPIFSFSVLWFYVGHIIESGPIGLELAHEHRNYVPGFGPVLGAVHTTVHFGRTRIRPALVAAAFLAIALALAVQTLARARTWSSDDILIRDMAMRHPGSARSQYMMGELLVRRYLDQPQALGYFRCAAALMPGELAYQMRVATEVAAPSRPARKTTSAPVKDASRTPPCTADTPQLETLPDRTDREHIVKSLANEPLSADTIARLRDLGSCSTGATAACAALQPIAREWLRAALLNDRLSATARNDFTVFLFDLSVAHRDYATALWAAMLGTDRDSANLTYILMAANARLLQNDLDGAENLLREFDARRGDTTDGLSSGRSELYRMLATRRANRQLHDAK